MIPLPDSVPLVTVTGWLTQSVADTGDDGRAPDMLPMAGTLTFKPNIVRMKLLSSTPQPMTVFPKEIVCTIDGTGHLLGPDLVVDVQLIGTGSLFDSYDVTFELEGIRKFTITVALPAGDTIDLADMLEIPRSASIDVEAWLVAATRSETASIVSTTARNASLVGAQRAEAAAVEAEANGTTISQVIAKIDETAEPVGLSTDTHIGIAGDIEVAANAEIARSDLAYAASGVPDYASSHTNRYDPVRNVYNWKSSNTRRIRAALGSAQAGVGRAVQTVIGESSSEAMVGTTTFSFVNNWPNVMRSTLVGQGIPSAGDGFVKAGKTSQAITDTRLAFTGTWLLVPAFATASETGSVATFEFVEGGSTIVVAYLGLDAGTFTVRIDGAIRAGGAITADGSADKLTAVFTGLADTPHTVTVTTDSATSVHLLGASSYSESGSLVNVLAYSGSDSVNSWEVGVDGYSISAIAEVTGAIGGTPAAVHIVLGVDDIQTYSATPGAITTAITALRGLFPNSDVVLHGQVMAGTGMTQTVWEAYLDALYTLADTLDCPLIDLYARAGDYSTANANGVMGDPTNPSLGFHREWGRAVGLLEAS